MPLQMRNGAPAKVHPISFPCPQIFSTEVDAEEGTKSERVTNFLTVPRELEKVSAAVEPGNRRPRAQPTSPLRRLSCSAALSALTPSSTPLLFYLSVPSLPYDISCPISRTTT